VVTRVMAFTLDDDRQELFLEAFQLASSFLSDSFFQQHPKTEEKSTIPPKEQNIGCPELLLYLLRSQHFKADTKEPDVTAFENKVNTMALSFPMEAKSHSGKSRASWVMEICYLLTSFQQSPLHQEIQRHFPNYAVPKNWSYVNDHARLAVKQEFDRQCIESLNQHKTEAFQLPLPLSSNQMPGMQSPISNVYSILKLGVTETALAMDAERFKTLALNAFKCTFGPPPMTILIASKLNDAIKHFESSSSHQLFGFCNTMFWVANRLKEKSLRFALQPIDVTFDSKTGYLEWYHLGTKPNRLILTENDAKTEADHISKVLALQTLLLLVPEQKRVEEEQSISPSQKQTESSIKKTRKRSASPPPEPTRSQLVEETDNQNKRLKMTPA